MKLSALTPDTRNANKGTARGRKLVRESLERYGAGRSILIDKSGNVIAGNKTVEGAKAAGLQDVQIVKTDGTKLIAVQRTDLDINDKKARELAIADNRASEVGLEWDVNVLKDFKAEDVDLSPFWDQRELVSFWANTGGDDAPEPKLDQAAELQRKWGTKTGQLWLIGRHRLLCGDSTQEADVARLWANVPESALPTLMVTDPPYGVEYDPKWRERYDKFERHATGKVANDDRCDWKEAWALFPGTVAYVWCASLHIHQVATSLEESGFALRASIIWVKQHFVFSQGHYHWQHEPCWYAVRNGGTAKWAGDRKQTTVWAIDNLNPMGGNATEVPTGHGTQKPVECMKRPMLNHAGNVYDPFLGSGTTVCAAEQVGRACFAIEIEPKYIAVTLERLSDMGLQPKLAA